MPRRTHELYGRFYTIKQNMKTMLLK
ncbi:hypothetical protein V12B01_12595 [Vibrio splendidus 12B01]|nr:hypothetical protein V12B01_12595 [Vibrio splendidus 12B01]